jgi:AraC-like DNA-binding protein
MPYTEHLPAAPLRKYVECYWTRDGRASDAVHRVLPDGCADVILDLRGGHAFAVGTMTAPLLFRANGPSDFFGVRFRPGGAAHFFRQPLAELTDDRVALGDVWREANAFEETIALAEDRVAAADAALLQRLRVDEDRRVDAAVDAIVRSGGTRRIGEIAGRIGISRQHLARRFLARVGVTPKTLARVVRFRRLVESVSADVDWAAAAVTHGYYDQAHLIADFRALAGVTPEEFLFSKR